MDAPPEVVAVGDCALDRVHDAGDGVGQTRLDELAAAYDWFPGPEESRGIERATFEETVGPELRRLEWEQFHGGKAANQAAAAARAGARTAFLGTVGSDPAPLDDLEARGVDVSAAAHRGAPTTVAYVFVDDGDSRTLGVYDPSVLVDVAYVEATLSALRRATVLLVADVFHRDAQRRLLGALEDPTVVYDPGVGTPAELLEHPAIDYLTPNAREAERLGSVEPAGTVVRTDASGATADRTTVPAPSVAVIDTTGAGDAFNGRFAAALADGVGLEAGLAAAVERASEACTHVGARRQDR